MAEIPEYNQEFIEEHDVESAKRMQELCKQAERFVTVYPEVKEEHKNIVVVSSNQYKVVASKDIRAWTLVGRSNRILDIDRRTRQRRGLLMAALIAHKVLYKLLPFFPRRIDLAKLNEWLRSFSCDEIETWIKEAIEFNSFGDTHHATLFDWVSFVNHSCVPNCVFDSETGDLVSIIPIKKDEELTICYLRVPSLSFADERRARLKRSWEFDCSCEACSNDYSGYRILLRLFKSCCWCGKFDASKRCSGCHVAMYCDMKCARHHHKFHKVYCSANKYRALPALRFSLDAIEKDITLEKPILTQIFG
jgi:hypothetical protein